MLSSVLHSKRAVAVNIAIMRAFVRLREMLATHKDLARKMADLEREQKAQGREITEVFKAIQKLLEPPKDKTQVGYRVSGPEEVTRVSMPQPSGLRSRPGTSQQPHVQKLPSTTASASRTRGWPVDRSLL